MNYLQNYYRELDELRRIAGASNENTLRPAFQNLLKAIGQEQQLILYAEYPFKSPTGTMLRADGVLMDRLRLVHGWWEAKDEKDDLDKEISAKLAKGYPSDNIIFEDTRTAVLLQNGCEIVRCPIENALKLAKLLDKFFNYLLPEVENFRVARDKFLTELPGVARALTELLGAAHHNNASFGQRAQDFLQLCQRSIGLQVTAHHVDEMLIQHILTDQIFRAVFPDSNFHQENHLARAIGELESSFFRGETRKNLLKRLEPYFAAIRQAAANTVTSAEKQDFLKQVYEDFYRAYNPKDADKLGIVYTPQEVVRFIIEGCDWLTQRHFNKRLSDKGLDILDPCTGTGTFIVDLLEYWRGDHQALISKFTDEVHANEVSILSYYIACLNIEQNFYEITNQWREFNGACFVNTLENQGFKQTYKHGITDLFGAVTDENHLRIQAQNARTIPVILGNPPYNANQQNENNNNKNDAAPWVDKRIKETYLAESTAQKTKLYDPYIRFFRWASDRLGDQGIVAFITNRSYLDKRSFDGFRQIVGREFQEIWLVDLLGDIRDKSEVSLDQGGNIFDIQTGVAIGFFVRNPELEGCKIHYVHAPEGISGLEKLRWLKSNHLPHLAKTGKFLSITPNKRNAWLNQPTEDWSAWLPVASKEVKLGKEEGAIFKLHSLGVVTSRDEWIYGFSKQEVSEKTKKFISCYAAEQQRWEQAGRPREIENFVKRHIKWTSELTAHLVKGLPLNHDPRFIVRSAYRPFVEKFLYYDKVIVHRTYQQTKIFPINLVVENLVIVFTGADSQKPFTVACVTMVTDLHFVGVASGTACIPLYQYLADGTRQENITDWALEQFRAYYGQLIEKQDIFNYVYAVLHDPRYRQKFALNLKQEFPRIPFHPNFYAWAEIGAQLIQLHAYFEKVTPWELQRIETPTKIAPKCRLKADKLNNQIEIDTQTTLANIPPAAWNYQLGNRSALEWILDQYKEKTPKDATIREQFNTYRFADHKEPVIELLTRICRVSVETMQLIEKIEQLT